MKKYILFSIIVLAALWFLGSASAQAATYYVNATTGSDGRTTFQAQNSGTPWLTIQKCANNAVAGDTCSVAAGVYNEAVSTSASGTDAAHMITFQGVGYVYITSMTIKHDWIKFDNFRMDNDGTHATRLTGDDSFITLWGNHCIVSNNFMRQGPSETNSCNGINGDIAGSHNNLITYNEMDGLRYLNIQITGDDQIASYNKIHGNIDDVFRTNKCRNCQILYNEHYGGLETGRHCDFVQAWSFTDYSYNVLIEGNYVHDTQASICVIDRRSNPPDPDDHIYDYTWRNNIFVNTVGNAQFSPSGFKWYNNLFWNVGVSVQAISMSQDRPGTEVKNNICIVPSNAGWSYNGPLYDRTASAMGADYNYYAQTPALGWAAVLYVQEAHAINGGNPQFVNYAYQDFHLNSNSPARGKGVNLSSLFTKDKDGYSRPSSGAWDIGAYEYTVSTPSDTTPPSIPANLSATAVSSSQINLSWIASTDNVGVTGYRIYRLGTQIGTSASNSYSNIGLIANTTYSYTVSAYDAAGNVSAQSASATATTQTPSANIEAESGSLVSPMQIVSDSSASGGSYIRTNTADQGTASYSFNVATAGVYKILARVYAPDGASDSFYFKIDNLAEDVWDLNPTGLADQFNLWREDEITKRGTGTPDLPQYDPYTVNLTAGNHTITFRGRETNARLDYFYLVKITDTTPPAAPSGVRVQ